MKSSAIAATAHFSSAGSVRKIMAVVLLALAPGIVVSSIFFGSGVLMQISFALAFAIAFEAIMLKLRAQPMVLFLADLSAALTAVLFALLIPASAPWWIAAAGMAVAIVFAKHFFGGLGRNLFNPAMAGLVAVKLCFPHEFGLSTTAPSPASVSDFSGHGYDSLALAYGLGGVFLLWKKIIPWQTPIAMLGAAVLFNLAFPLLDPGGPTLAHSMLPAVWLLCAFFIVTDPVTGCPSTRGRLCFGAGVGALGGLIGHWRNDPSGLAFAVLLMNSLAPWIDRHVRAKFREQSTTQMDADA